MLLLTQSTRVTSIMRTIPPARLVIMRVVEPEIQVSSVMRTILQAR